jgi:hypothetical protein
MTTPRAAARLAAWALALQAVVSPVATAQTSGGAAPDRGVVRFSSDIFGGWDVSLTPDQGLVTAPGRRDVTYGGANAALDYSRTFRNVAFIATGNMSARYSPSFVDELAPFYGASLALTSAGATRWSWSLTQSVGYGRQNAAALFAGGGGFGGVGLGIGLPGGGIGVPTGQVDYQLAGVDALSSTSAATLGFGLSRRDRVQLGANAGTVFNRDGDESQFLRVGGLFSYSRQLTRYSSLNAGYDYFENHPLGDTPAPGVRQRISSFNLGLGYARPLPFSRETTIEINSGVSGTPRRDGWFYTAVGSAGLARDLGRTWQAQLTAFRALRFVPAFADPTLINAVSVGLQGNLSRRLTSAASANYSFGESGFIDTSTKFDAYSASVQMRYAVFRLAGLFTEYYYFLASLRGSVPAAFPAGELARHGVRVGMSFGTELLGGRR